MVKETQVLDYRYGGGGDKENSDENKCGNDCVEERSLWCWRRAWICLSTGYRWFAVVPRRIRPHVFIAPR